MLGAGGGGRGVGRSGAGSIYEHHQKNLIFQHRQQMSFLCCSIKGNNDLSGPLPVLWVTVTDFKNVENKSLNLSRNSLQTVNGHIFRAVETRKALLAKLASQSQSSVVQTPKDRKEASRSSLIRRFFRLKDGFVPFSPVVRSMGASSGGYQASWLPCPSVTPSDRVDSQSHLFLPVSGCWATHTPDVTAFLLHEGKSDH